jgi:Cu/Ag efflux pump CusA
VVVGGLSLSAVLTLLIIPPQLAIFLPKREGAAAEAVPLREAAE